MLKTIINQRKENDFSKLQGKTPQGEARKTIYISTRHHVYRQSNLRTGTEAVKQEVSSLGNQGRSCGLWQF